MTSTNEQGFNGEFDGTEVEPLVEKLLGTLNGVPANMAGMALITALLEMNRLEAEQQGVESFDGFELQSRVKDFRIKIRAERQLGGLDGLLQALMAADNTADNGDGGVVGAIMKAVAAAKDDPESEDYCDCQACNERRKMMAELRSAKPSTH